MIFTAISSCHYLNYVVIGKVRGTAAHEAHDADPAFKAFDEKAEAFEPEGPSVWRGETIFEI